MRTRQSPRIKVCSLLWNWKPYSFLLEKTTKSPFPWSWCYSFTQVASKALKIPTSLIYISETSTNTVPNTSPTAASVSTDINGQAVYVRSLGGWKISGRGGLFSAPKRWPYLSLKWFGEFFFPPKIKLRDNSEPKSLTEDGKVLEEWGGWFWEHIPGY